MAASNVADIRSAETGRSREWLGYTVQHGALVALVVLVLANLLFTPHFASWANLANVGLQVSTTVLAATGLTLVIASGGIDLSVGSVMALAAAVAAVSLPHGVLLAVGVSLAAGTAVGAVTGTMTARLSIQPIVVTLAMLIAGRGLAQVVSNNGQLILIANERFNQLGRGNIGPLPVPVVLMLLVIAFAWFVMRDTIFGRYVLAVGGSAAAARMSGVPVIRTRLAVYMISGFLAALAGLVEAARLGASDPAKIGLGMELDAIAAVVIGGTLLSGGRANVPGTLIGALLLQVITTGMNMHVVGFAWALVVKAAILLAAVYLQRTARE
jgi:simple sugar transport system permease protein/ribose transport system permease protein